jgi:hypothetical protein
MHIKNGHANYIGKLIFLLIICIPLRAHCEMTVDVYCFNAGGAKAINFELHALADPVKKWSGGFVKYQNSEHSITLVLKNVVNQVLNKNAPNQETTTWIEVYENEITGEYRMMSQGANIHSMTYRNYRTRKETGFVFNVNAISQTRDSCQW